MAFRHSGLGGLGEGGACFIAAHSGRNQALLILPFLSTSAASKLCKLCELCELCLRICKGSVRKPHDLLLMMSVPIINDPSGVRVLTRWPTKV